MTKRKHPAANGSKWIRPDKRLSIYLRDGLACAYCGDSIENGASLSLDHVIPYSKGGSNEASNLTTCCKRCNSSRGNRPMEEFAEAVATYLNHGVTAAEITAQILRCTTSPLEGFHAEAKAMIARRGSYGRVMASM